jgi:hypothetical protein
LDKKDYLLKGILEHDEEVLTGEEGKEKEGEKKSCNLRVLGRFFSR